MKLDKVNVKQSIDRMRIAPKKEHTEEEEKKRREEENQI